MIRRGLIQFMALILVALPLLGVFAEKSHAASSRVAVIKEMKGTVKVKKAGGSKEFTAFAKMSLNEGDVLKTGAGSSAVLQFANGTSEDDKMTVAAHTTLTFSKLSNSKGTSTKVSMFNGSAWVDVKSITSKNDEFSLETPTAIMGVRGTHLLVTVDPATGATHLTVAAGVVRATTTGSGNSDTKDVYPTQNALFTEDEKGDSEITIAPVDLQLLMEQSDSSIVQAILENSAAIIAENEQYVAEYEEQGIPGSLGSSEEDLARFKSNTENLLGAIADQALKSGLLTQERLDQIINEVLEQSGITVDLNKKDIQLTEEEQQLKEQQRLKDEAAKKQADALKKQQEENRKKNEELLNKLEDERKAKESANKLAEEEKNRKALEDYQAQLAEAEKQRFEADKEKRKEEANQAASPSPSPSPSSSSTPVTSSPPVLSTNANLSGLSLSDATISFSPDTTTYSVTVPNAVSSIVVNPTTPNGANSSIKINTVSVVSGSGSSAITLTAGVEKVISVVVTAQDGATTKTYTINVTRAFSNDTTLSNLTVSAGAFSFNALTQTYHVSVMNTVSSVKVTPTLPTGSTAAITVNGIIVASGSESGAISLTAGANKVISVVVTAQDGTTTNTYTINVTRALSNDTTLSNLTLSDGALSFKALTETYDVSVLNTVNSVKVTPTLPTGSTAAISVDGAAVVSGTESSAIALTAGVNKIISVVVTAQDGTTTKTYTINVTRSLSNDTTLSNVTMSDGAFSFNASTEMYDVSVLNTVSSVKVTPTLPTGSTAAVTVDGVAVASGSESGAIAITAGVTKVISVIVTAQDGTTAKTYTINVTRVDNNPNVADIMLKDASNNPIEGFTFSQATSELQVVPLQDNLTEMKLSVLTESNAAFVTVFFNNQYVAPSGGNYILPLNQNVEDLEVIVGSGDGTDHRYYHYVFTRGTVGSSDARLSNLVVDIGDTQSYDWRSSVYFNNNMTEYYVFDDSEQPEIRLKLETYNEAAIITGVYYGEAILGKGEDGYYTSTLNDGDSTIVISVRSQDGSTTQNYYVNIHTEPPLTLPHNVTSWNMSYGAEGTIDWQYQGLHRFSAQVVEPISSYDMSLSFDTTRLNKILLTELGVESPVPIEWSTATASNTIQLHEGYNIYNMAMYDTNENPIDNYIFYLFVGSDSQLSAEAISFKENFEDVYNFHPADAGTDVGQGSFFVHTDQEALLMFPYFSTENYYVSNAVVLLNGVQLTVDELSTNELTVDDLYYLNLNVGMNELLIKMKDSSGLFAKTIRVSIFRGTELPVEFEISGMTATFEDGTPVEHASITPFVEKFSVASNQNMVKFFPNYSGANNIFVYQNGEQLSPNTDGSYSVTFGEGQLEANVVVRVENTADQFVSYLAEFEKAGLAYTTNWTSKQTSDSTDLVWYPVLDSEDYVNSHKLFTVIPSDQTSIQMTILLEPGASGTMYTYDYQNISLLPSPEENTIIVNDLLEGYNHQSVTIYSGGDQAPHYYDLEILRGEPTSTQISLQDPFGWDKDNNEELEFLAVDEFTFLKILPETTNVQSFELSFDTGEAIVRSEVKFNGVPINDDFEPGIYSINGLSLGWNDIEVTNYDWSGKYPTSYTISILVGELPTEFVITNWNANDNLENIVSFSSSGSDLQYTAEVSSGATEVAISPSLVSGSMIEAIYVENSELEELGGYYSIPLNPDYPTTYVRVLVRAEDGHLIGFDLLLNTETTNPETTNPETTNPDTTFSSLTLVQPNEYAGDIFSSEGVYRLSLPEEISNIVFNPKLGPGQLITASWRIDGDGFSQPLEWSAAEATAALNMEETHIFFTVLAADGMTSGTTEVVVTRTSLSKPVGILEWSTEDMSDGITETINWTYTSLDRFYTTLPSDTTDIAMHLTVDDGFSYSAISGSGSSVLVNDDGTGNFTISGFESGINTVELTTTIDGTARTYYLYIYIGDDVTLTYNTEVQKVGVEYLGKHYFIIDSQATDLVMYPIRYNYSTEYPLAGGTGTYTSNWSVTDISGRVLTGDAVIYYELPSGLELTGDLIYDSEFTAESQAAQSQDMTAGWQINTQETVTVTIPGSVSGLEIEVIDENGETIAYHTNPQFEVSFGTYTIVVKDDNNNIMAYQLIVKYPV